MVSVFQELLFLLKTFNLISSAVSWRLRIPDDARSVVCSLPHQRIYKPQQAAQQEKKTFVRSLPTILLRKMGAAIAPNPKRQTF